MSLFTGINMECRQGFKFLNDKLNVIISDLGMLKTDLSTLKTSNGFDAEKRSTMSTKITKLENAFEDNVKKEELWNATFKVQSDKVSNLTETIKFIQHKLKSYQPQQTIDAFSQLESNLVTIEKDVQQKVSKSGIERMRQQHNQDISQLHEDINKNIASLNKVIEKNNQNSQEVSNLKTEIGQLTSQHQEDISALIKQHEVEMLQQIAETKESIASLKSEHENVNLIQKYQEDMEQQHNTLKSDMLQQIQKHQEDWREDIASQNQTIASLKEDTLTEVNDLQQSVHSSVESLTTTMRSLQEHQESLDSRSSTSMPEFDNMALTTRNQMYHIYETSEKMQNKQTQDQLLLRISPTLVHGKMSPKEQARLAFEATLPPDESQKIIGQITKVKVLKKKQKKNDGTLLIMLKNGAKQKITKTLIKFKTEFNESPYDVRSNICKTTRVKKSVLGCIASSLNHEFGPKTACIPRYADSAYLFFKENEESKPVKMSYFQCIEKFSDLIDEATELKAYHDLSHIFYNDKAAQSAVLLL
jgi:hypothetical protein